MSEHSAEELSKLEKTLADFRHQVIASRIAELAAVYGSVRAVGAALRIDHAYLQRLASGEKTNPSSSVMAKLGLEHRAF